MHVCALHRRGSGILSIVASAGTTLHMYDPTLGTLTLSYIMSISTDDIPSVFGIWFLVLVLVASCKTNWITYSQLSISTARQIGIPADQPHASLSLHKCFIHAQDEKFSQ